MWLSLLLPCYLFRNISRVGGLIYIMPKISDSLKILIKLKLHCAASLKHSNWREFFCLFVCFLVVHDACCLTCVLAFITYLMGLCVSLNCNGLSVFDD